MATSSTARPEKINAGAATMYLRVTDLLRSEIISGRLKPNARLKAPDVAQRFGVSPSPVREALQKLQAEGLVVLKPNHGAVVRGIDAHEFTHMMRLRAAIEAMQAGLCAEQATPAFVAKLETQQARFEKAIETGDREARLKANAVLHRLINGIDGSELAQDILVRIDAITAAIRREWPLSPERLGQARAEHSALVDAIRNRDVEAAERVGRAHVLATLNDILEQMRSGAARA